MRQEKKHEKSTYQLASWKMVTFFFIAGPWAVSGGGLMFEASFITKTWFLQYPGCFCRVDFFFTFPLKNHASCLPF